MNQSGRPLTFAVLGGAGAMGRITVRDLIETTPLGTEVLIADYQSEVGICYAKTPTCNASKCYTTLNSSRHRLKSVMTSKQI